MTSGSEQQEDGPVSDTPGEDGSADYAMMTELEIEHAKRAAAIAAERARLVEKWDAVVLPTCLVSEPAALEDVKSNCQRQANVTGMPQRIVSSVKGRNGIWIIEPEHHRCIANGALRRMPQWVKEKMGW